MAIYVLLPISLQLIFSRPNTQRPVVDSTLVPVIWGIVITLAICGLIIYFTKGKIPDRFIDPNVSTNYRIYINTMVLMTIIFLIHMLSLLNIYLMTQSTSMLPGSGLMTGGIVYFGTWAIQEIGTKRKEEIIKVFFRLFNFSIILPLVAILIVMYDPNIFGLVSQSEFDGEHFILDVYSICMCVLPFIAGIVFLFINSNIIYRWFKGSYKQYPDSAVKVKAVVAMGRILPFFTGEIVALTIYLSSHSLLLLYIFLLIPIPFILYIRSKFDLDPVAEQISSLNPDNKS
jgi:hypothetical protein